MEQMKLDSDMAARHYERATQLDPSYALAWARLSRVRNWQANSGLFPAAEGHRVAREAVERALALNPNLAEAHAQMARIKRYDDFDWAGAYASIQRARLLSSPGIPNICFRPPIRQPFSAALTRLFNWAAEPLS